MTGYFQDKEERIIDLHIHTNYSDGEHSPDEVIRKAAEKEISTIAITDHDTIAGLKQIDRTSTIVVDSGIDIIDGIELSAKVPIGQMHILGYGIDKNNEQLNEKMDELRLKNLYAILDIMNQIKKDYGITFSYDDIRNLVNSNHNLGRPDLAKLCMKYGYATTIDDAFQKYLHPAFNKTRSTGKGISYEECLKLIIDSGGIPVLAHPKSLKLSEKDFLILLKKMIQLGLQGIEVYHSSHSKEEMEHYLKIAEQFSLLVSGGSDYHGSNVKPDIELGTGKNNNIHIKQLSLLDYLKNKNKIFKS